MAFFLTRIKNLSNIIRLREGGGIGRRVRLRGVWLSVWVQVPSFTPKQKDQPKGLVFFVLWMGLE